MHRQNIRRGSHLADRREIFDHVIRQLFEKHRVHGIGHAAHQQRVTIGGGTRHQLRTDVGAAAGTIFHDHLLADILGKFRRHHARHKIDATAGYIGRDKTNGAGRVTLRLGMGRTHQQRRNADNAD